MRTLRYYTCPRTIIVTFFAPLVITDELDYKSSLSDVIIMLVENNNYVLTVIFRINSVGLRGGLYRNAGLIYVENNLIYDRFP